MKFRDFLRDRWGYVAAAVCSAAFAAGLLSVLGVGVYAACYLAGVILLSAAAAFFTEFFQKRGFYNTLLKSMDRLDKKYLLSEVIREPSFREGKLLCEVLRETEKSMNDEVGEYRRETTDYREYVETWVHEIKTPIAACQLILENNPGPMTRAMRLDFNRIEGYVEQALFYARSGTVEKDFALRRTTLRELADAALRKNSALLIESGVRIHMESLNAEVLADPKWVEFILGQILANSVKYRKAAPEVFFDASISGREVTLTVEDNGVGIPQKDLGRVFEKGFTGENGRRVRRSTGIGLYLCKQLCDKMGLGISILSVEGTGTAVSLVFPTANGHRL